MKRLIFLLFLLSALSPLRAQRFQLPLFPKDHDEIWVLCVGNSFTYYYDADIMLTDIAASQGVRMQVGKFLKGGQTFGQHLQLKHTLEAVDSGGYDYALLQDQSVNAARYARDGDAQVLEDLKTLKSRIVRKSPDCKVILERTWSYSGKEAGGFETAANLDKYLEKGNKELASKAHTWLSPIGVAFNTVYRERPDIKLLYKDDKHQGPAGSYLKACVNYLVITGQPFHGNVDRCGLDPATAAYLQSVAEKTVLGKESRYHIKRDRKFRGCPTTRVIAHRGFHLEENTPENSIASLKASQRIGVYGSEFDIWITSDSVIVINHNKSFPTDPEGQIIKESRYEDLSGIRLSNGEPVPTFGDYLDQTLRQPRTKLICELKRHGDPERERLLFDTAYAMVTKKDMTRRIIWQSFSYDLCRYIREKAPDATVIYICMDEKRMKTPEEIAADGISGVNYKSTVYDAHPGLVEALHAKGLFANLCVEKDPEVIARFVTEGVDFVSSNDPAGIQKMIRER